MTAPSMRPSNSAHMCAFCISARMCISRVLVRQRLAPRALKGRGSFSCPRLGLTAVPHLGPGRWEACPFKCRTWRKIKHSTVAQRSQTKSSLPVNVTLPRIGGCHENTISRKRSTGRVELGNASGNGCRTRTAATAAARSGLHLEWLLCWRERGLWGRTEHS